MTSGRTRAMETLAWDSGRRRETPPSDLMWGRKTMKKKSMGRAVMRTGRVRPKKRVKRRTSEVGVV